VRLQFSKYSGEFFRINGNQPPKWQQSGVSDVVYAEGSNILGGDSMRYVKLGSVLALTASCMLLMSARSMAEDKAAVGSISGTVVDASGAPVADAIIRVLAPRTHAKGEKPKALAEGDKPRKKGDANEVAKATTDQTGTFKVEGLAPGDYAVMAMLKGKGRGRERVTVMAGQDATISIKLEAGGKKQK
jgi:hypothetical protein